MTIQYEGTLEIDQERGVIYFHSKYGVSLLRICQLPTPIPEPIKFVSGSGRRHIPNPKLKDFNLLDLNFKESSVSWAPCICWEDPDSIENITCPIHGFVEKSKEIEEGNPKISLGNAGDHY